MTISSDLPSPAMLKPVGPPPASEAGESKSVPERDGDADDGASKVSLKSFQGTKINTLA